MIRVLQSSQNSIYIAFKCVQYVNWHDIRARGSPRPRPRAVVVDGRWSSSFLLARTAGETRLLVEREMSDRGGYARRSRRSRRRDDATRRDARATRRIDRFRAAMFSSEIRSFAHRKSSRRFGAETIHDGRFTTDDGRFALRVSRGRRVPGRRRRRRGSLADSFFAIDDV